MQSSRRWLIYGTGASAIGLGRRAIDLGVDVLVAGRNHDRAAAVGAALGVESIVLPLDDQAELHRIPADVRGVVNAAGPYAIITPPLLRFCLTRSLAYVDLSNEQSSHEIAWAAQHAARERGIVVVPGAGFGTLAAELLAAEVVKRFTRIEEILIVLPPRQSSGTTPSVQASSARVLATRPAEARAGSIRTIGQRAGVGRLRLPDGARTIVPLGNGDLQALARTIPSPRIRVCAQVSVPMWLAVAVVPMLRWRARQTFSRGTIDSAQADVSSPLTESERPRDGGGTLWARVLSTGGRVGFLGLDPTSRRQFAVEAALDVVHAIDRRNPIGVFTPAQILEGEDLHKRVMRFIGPVPSQY